MVNNKEIISFFVYLSFSIKLDLHFETMIFKGVLLIAFSSFLSPKLINASQEMTIDWVCKPAVLEDLLKSGDNELDYEFLSQTFCNLDKDTLISILDEVFKQLDIGDLVEEVWQIILDI